MRDILSEYGPESPNPQSPRAACGGVEEFKKLPYSPPVGPSSMMHKGPGLANGTNHGNCGTQGKH